MGGQDGDGDRVYVDGSFDVNDARKVTGTDEQEVPGLIVEGIVYLAMKIGEHGANH